MGHMVRTAADGTRLTVVLAKIEGTDTQNAREFAVYKLDDNGKFIEPPLHRRSSRMLAEATLKKEIQRLDRQHKLMGKMQRIQNRKERIERAETNLEEAKANNPDWGMF